MSASWCSDAGREAVRGAGRLTAVTIALLVAASSLAPAHALAARDSGRVVHHVRIGPAGIQIERRGSRDSTASVEVEAGAGGRRVLKVEGAGGSPGDTGDAAVTVGPGRRGRGTSIVVDAGEDAVVRLFADASVPAGETVPGDVVAVFGSADVAGAVEGNVVAVFGSVRLHPGARVEGDAVAIGGALDQPAGAQVDGQSVAVGGPWVGWCLPTPAMLLVAVLAGWLATLLLTWLLSLLSSGPMLRVGSTASRHGAGSLFLGLVSVPFLLVGIAFVVLVAAMAGTRFAVALLFLCLLVFWVGHVAGSYVLGCSLLRRRPGEGGLMGPVFMGTLLIAVLLLSGVALSAFAGVARSLSLFFALLGLLLIAVLSTLGTGALFLSLMGTRPVQSPPANPTTPPPA